MSRLTEWQALCHSYVGALFGYKTGPELSTIIGVKEECGVMYFLYYNTRGNHVGDAQCRYFFDGASGLIWYREPNISEEIKKKYSLRGV